MKETALQSLFCEAVRDHKGFAEKLSNRFMIGVPDLVVKIPDFPTAFVEVKQREGVPWQDFKLEVTKLQDDWLTRAQEAGTVALVASFVQGRALNDLRLRVFTLDTVKSRAYIVPKSWWPSYVGLGKKHERSENLIDELCAAIAIWEGEGPGRR